jgi:acetoin utilization protein AcuC
LATIGLLIDRGKYIMTVSILYSAELKEYDFGTGHPFRGDRYELFYNYLRNNLAEDDIYRIMQSDPADDADLLLICHKNYIEFTKGYYEAANFGIAYPGRFSEFHSMDNMPTGKPGNLEAAARLVIGQAKMACQLVQEGKFEKAISIGGGLHHARPNYGEGFCLYNDVAFCATYLKQEFQLDRIVILDTDAHAGNGTSEYFYDDPRELFIDLHQDPGTLYPGTGFVNQIGSGKGKGFTINIPLPQYAGHDSCKLVFETIVEPVVSEFKPQIIIRNGGSDPHFNDGLTMLGLSLKGFNMIGDKVRQMAGVCDNKVIDLIASGYNIEVLPSSWMALITGLIGIDFKTDEPGQIPEKLKSNLVRETTELVVEEVKEILRDYWACLR